MPILPFWDHPWWYLEDLAIEIGLGFVLFICDNAAFILVMVVVQWTQGLPSWTWGVFLGNLLYQVKENRLKLLSPRTSASESAPTGEPNKKESS